MQITTEPYTFSDGTPGYRVTVESEGDYTDRWARAAKADAVIKENGWRYAHTELSDNRAVVAIAFER